MSKGVPLEMAATRRIIGMLLEPAVFTVDLAPAIDFLAFPEAASSLIQ